MLKTLNVRKIKPFAVIFSSRNYAKASTKEKESLRKWEPIIGLEIHAQIAARSKLFSGSASRFAAPVNSLVSFFDAALPGTLPVLNRRCVEAGIQTAMALQCQLNMVSMFDRKHYFYADLPAGYQITQQRRPLAVGGQVSFFVSRADGKVKLHVARLTQVQLEQDSGKSLHDMEKSISLIDLNRAGVGLMEIITEPDFRSSEEATAFVKELQLILQTIGTCDGRMEEGSLRVDASVSIHHPGDPLGTRSEVKNLNSIRALGKAIDFEIERQIEVVENGGEVVNETRGFDVETGETVAMRDKERLHDYRFMAEPNLPPLRLYTTDTVPTGVPPQQVINIDELRERLPELPAAKRERLQRSHGLTLDHSNILVNEPGLVDCFDLVVSQRHRSPKVTANICINDIFAALNKRGISFVECGLNAEHIGQLVDLISDRTIALATARKVIDELLDNQSQSPKQIVVDNDWSQVTDERILEEMCNKVLAENKASAVDYKRGKTKVLNFLVGQVQKELSGKADARAVTGILQRLLSQ